MFTPTVEPDHPDLTALLFHHLGECIDNHDGDAAVETLQHMKTAAGDQYTRELIDYLIASGLDHLAAAQQ